MPGPMGSSPQRPRVLAVVPARGGSKGLPRKNLRLLAGRPLVAHAVAAGLAAELVDRVVCSTDDPEIAEAARETGADSVKSVCLARQHPHKMWRLGADRSLTPFLATAFRLERGPDVPRAELEDVYWQN